LATPAKPAALPIPSRVLPGRDAEAVPALASVGAPSADGSLVGQILRHSFVVQLGELPPAVASDVDDAEELIE
jgi:hypothetical protein